MLVPNSGIMLNFLYLSILILSLMNNEGEFHLNWEDDILEGSAVTRDGAVVHPAVVGEKS